MTEPFHIKQEIIKERTLDTYVNTSGKATKVDESSGRRKSKVGTRKGDGNERKMASTVGPNKANMQWNRKRKETDRQ